MFLENYPSYWPSVAALEGADLIQDGVMDSLPKGLNCSSDPEDPVLIPSLQLLFKWEGECMNKVQIEHSPSFLICFLAEKAYKTNTFHMHYNQTSKQPQL